MRPRAVEEIYPFSVGEQQARYARVSERFREQFHAEPFFFARAPGRVNIIGEHVDYSGYSVLPMAIENDAVIAVGQSSEENGAAVRLINMNEKFEERNQVLGLSERVGKVFQEHHWTNYFLAATQGLITYYPQECNGNDINLNDLFTSLSQKGTIQLLVDGRVPVGSGLSSSSSLVCSYTLAMVRLLEVQGVVNQPIASASQLASICAKSERFIGIESGGMDQAISYLAEQDYAMRIDFHPSLCATKVQLPPPASFVLCDSLVGHTLQAEASRSGYNVRVVECRLAAVVLATLAGLDNPLAIRTLSELENAYVPEESESVERLRKCEELAEKSLQESYTWEEIMSIICPDAGDPDNFKKQWVGSVTSPQVLSNLKLRSRAVHVFSEARRVLEFQQICDQSATAQTTHESEMKLLGDIMNDSHRSCAENFECSCGELNKVVEYARSSGALGARLTGAGWGGWCITLVPTILVEDFLSSMSRFYSEHAPLQEKPGSRFFFPTKPANGACIVFSS